MINPVISDKGLYKIPNAINPMWKLASSTPRACDMIGLFINNDNKNRVKPVNRMEVIKLKIMCFFL